MKSVSTWRLGADRQRLMGLVLRDIAVLVVPGAFTGVLGALATTRVAARHEGTLNVHGAAQSCLIVNDLKLGDSSGDLALWIGPGTEGYFTGLQIRE